MFAVMNQPNDPNQTRPSADQGSPALRERTIFMLVRALPAWLALAPAARFAFVDETVRPLLEAHRGVRLRYFDAEAWNARVSDVIMWQTRDLAAFEAVVEALREGPFWGTYFDVVEIIPALEDGFAIHYGVEPLGAAEGPASEGPK